MRPLQEAVKAGLDTLQFQMKEEIGNYRQHGGGRGINVPGGFGSNGTSAAIGHDPETLNSVGGTINTAQDGGGGRSTTKVYLVELILWSFKARQQGIRIVPSVDNQPKEMFLYVATVAETIDLGDELCVHVIPNEQPLLDLPIEIEWVPSRVLPRVKDGDVELRGEKSTVSWLGSGTVSLEEDNRIFTPMDKRYEGDGNLEPPVIDLQFNLSGPVKQYPIEFAVGLKWPDGKR
ncbi:hypothetical protein EON81_28240 [bacterium]|nr:MAG: hypothetical protein EON81_28240 [bacterium]